MYVPSVTTVLSVAFLAYMAHSMWSIAQLFLHPSCDPSKVGLAPTSKEGKDTPVFCLQSALWAKGSVWTKSKGSEPVSPRLRVLFVTSTSGRRIADASGFDYVGHIDVLDIEETIERKFKVSLTESVRKNGTMHILSFTVPYRKDENPDTDWSKMISHQDVTNAMMPLTVHHVPEAKTFNLLGEEAKTADKEKKTDRLKADKVSDKKPVTHIRAKITVSVMTDDVAMASNEIPPELYYFLKFKPAASSKDSSKHEYLPISYLDELSLRLRDLVIVNATDKTAEVSVTYRPISYGKMRMFLQFTTALASMHSLGFTAKDTDEVKGIFADTNMMLLLITFGVSTVHLLFDFLAFKNEINFWRKKKSMVGLSTRTVLWRAFSQTVVFLYLMDEETSLLVLIPSGIASLIEMWKVTKAFKVRVEFKGGFVPRVSLGSATDGEKTTEAFDSESMRYLSYVLYPLCLGGAVYSLVYTPHKSWYSWTVQSLVNGVYAFGFIFMLPQLFVNYKLKSVAHLPWRAFMYKAFNTFIDDLFAFIITMPTAHRVACFRDDVVFLIYLYQRYLYPVDKSRVDIGAAMADEDGEVAVSEKEEKKTQ